MVITLHSCHWKATINERKIPTHNNQQQQVSTITKNIFRYIIWAPRSSQPASGQVRGSVGERRVPWEEPGHHGERGALIPLGAALHWLEQWPLVGLASSGSFIWLLRLAKPVLVSGIFLCTQTEPGNNSNSALFKARNFSQLKAVCEWYVLFLINYVQACLEAPL